MERYQGRAFGLALRVLRDEEQARKKIQMLEARIRQGDLTAGRRDLDVAVALDPSSALLRTYLGKAYFEEVRDDLAEQQFGIAKELDPNDPAVQSVIGQPCARFENGQRTVFHHNDVIDRLPPPTRAVAAP